MVLLAPTLPTLSLQRLTGIPLHSPSPLISSKTHLSPRKANTLGRPSLQSEQLSSVQKWGVNSRL